jgi:hypothetical protein
MDRGTAFAVNGSREEEQEYSRRYTDKGINVVALDRRGRGLHRARPERRYGTGRVTMPPEGSSLLLRVVVIGALLVGMLALAISRLG